ncbi:MAG TPA: glutaredoxin [Deltaproteobacteria bacterium]|nr:MAG: glutaredoxin [candidate division KSB1 bacterium]HDM78576.1 glutaredoxin [Deltaproteobacteria bacterium]
MAMLEDKVKDQVKKELAGLKEEVKLIVFTQELECQYCRENRILTEEVASLSDKIGIEVYNFAIDKEKVEEYKVDKIPAIVVMGEKDYGIRFYGLPGGYEFVSLIEAIKVVSARDSGLAPESRELVKKLTRPVHIQVFVTLTCPYCSRAVELAHKLALESDLIRSDMVEAAEFPQLVNKYNVMAVPKIVINGEIQFEGALPEPAFLEQVMKANQM